MVLVSGRLMFGIRLRWIEQSEKRMKYESRCMGGAGGAGVGAGWRRYGAEPNFENVWLLGAF